MSFARLIRILRSASFRLPLIYAVLFVLSAGALFVTVYWTATAAMQADMAAVLRTEAYQLAEIHSRSGLPGLAEQITRRMNFRTRGPIFYLLQAPNRRVVVGNLPGMPPVNGVVDFVPQTDTPEPEAPPSKLTGFGLTLPDGSFLLVAQDADRLTEMQHAIARAFVWASGLALLLAIAGGALIGTSFLRRIDTITRTSLAIMEGDLSARIPVRGTHDEIDQLVSSLNAMLSRIQQLMDGLRQVSSDIAHDLRTPLGRLRQHLEDARARATTTADYDAATDAAIEEADELLETFSALLRIAQVEAGAQKRGFTDVDLSELVKSVGEAYQPAAEDSEHTLDYQIEDGVHLTGDRQLAGPDDLEPGRECAAPYAGRLDRVAGAAPGRGPASRSRSPTTGPAFPRPSTSGSSPASTASTAAARPPAAASAWRWSRRSPACTASPSGSRTSKPGLGVVLAG